jgi:hypothetical protein
LIGAVLASGMATMSELGTTLSTEDVYDLIEVAAVHNYNSRPRDGN